MVKILFIRGRIWRLFFLGFAWTLTIASAGWGATPEVLAGLRADHPRILAHEEDFHRIQQTVKTDALAKHWYAELKTQGEAMLTAPTTRHHLRDGVRLLYESREVLERVRTLGVLHRIERDPRYVARVWADMKAAAEFPDWNPKHFLDVAEMAMAFALAYDWFYDDWSDAQRQTICDALVRHAFKPAAEAYRAGAWWTNTKTNWTQVCDGGLMSAALAIGDAEPEQSAEILRLCLGSLPLPMSRYAPDGGYEEGAGYWDYGTSYNVYALAALNSALGRDFGVGATEGFDRTGAFPIQLTGPTGRPFNFADADETPVRAPVLFYLASHYRQPAYARFAARQNRGTAFDLLWFRPELLQSDGRGLPLDAIYENVGVATMRSSWDANALFVAVKAGHNGRPHGHLDLGSFVLEAQGVRWCVDLGREDYNLPAYGSAEGRATYYRCRTEGHNTLVIDPSKAGGQPDDAFAPIALANSTVSVDLAQAYGRPVARRVTLDRGAGRVDVVDTIESSTAVDAWWFMHTQAKIALTSDGRAATLTQEGKTLRVELAAPADARFEALDAQPLPASPHPAGQNPNNGATLLNRAPDADFVVKGETPVFGPPNPAKAYRKLAVRLAGVRQSRIEVRFVPPAGK